ncbi:MAG: DUF4065 domain-containing protein [Pyrinomonadaceae bacterium]|nr:DUF4065 domain-containing protein [Pyrinomonadaceae bacterium]
MSALESLPFGTKTVSADSTQSEQVVVRPDNLSIISGKSQAQQSNLTVHDVAAFILQQQGEMTAMKLQKLVYYSQAWSLVWDEAPLFPEPIEAWANGPVVRSLYVRHQGTFKVNNWDGDPAKLSETQRETILKVLEFYGPMPAQVLSDLTHNETPWLKARAGLAVGDRGSRVISHAEMAEYYSSLV